MKKIILFLACIPFCVNAQNTFKAIIKDKESRERLIGASDKLIIETGLRADTTNQNSFFVLPRISALHKFTNKFSTRIDSGLGYKTPTIFTEDAEENAFGNIKPLDFKN